MTFKRKCGKRVDGKERQMDDRRGSEERWYCNRSCGMDDHHHFRQRWLINTCGCKRGVKRKGLVKLLPDPREEVMGGEDEGKQRRLANKQI